MSKNQSVRWFLIAASLLFGAATPSPMLWAMTLYVYDLDSLVYMSTDVAEAEIVRSYEANQISLIDVKVTLVHKGQFKKGLSVTLAQTNFYRKPKQNDFNTQLLAVGDRLILFVVRATPTEFNRIPKDAVIYEPLPGGMVLIQGESVFGFSQRQNPGPYVANVPPNPSKAKLLSVEWLREKIRDSLRDTKEWGRLVEADEDKLDVPRLLKLLADRSKETYGGRDYFTEQICIRFAQTHDLLLLSQALPLAKNFQESSILQHGFGTPQGREYLLGKVIDAKEPMAERFRYVSALQFAGAVYCSIFTDIRAGGYRPVGEADEGNSGYITRLARAASATVKDEALCGRLIHCINWHGLPSVQGKEAALLADLHGAFAVLTEFYNTKPSQYLQFAIEKVTTLDKSAYDKLNSPCGPLISILRPVDPAKYTKPEKRSLIFEYEYTAIFLKADVEVQPAVVLVHQGTQKRHVLPTQMRIRVGSGEGGSHFVVLPDNLPAGRYHVFLQLDERNGVKSTGHYFIADL